MHNEWNGIPGTDLSGGCLVDDGVRLPDVSATVHSNGVAYYFRVTAPSFAGSCASQITPYLPTNGTGIPLHSAQSQTFIFNVLAAGGGGGC